VLIYDTWRTFSLEYWRYKVHVFEMVLLLMYVVLCVALMVVVMIVSLFISRMKTYIVHST
jgi:hypothetical protein